MKCLLVVPLLAFLLNGSRFFAISANYTNYRLPTAIQPDSYRLKVVTHLENPDNFTFHGEVTLSFRSLGTANNITLHVRNLTIDDKRIQLRYAANRDLDLCLNGIETVPDLDFYIINLCESLIKGEKYDVTLYFSGSLNEETEGYYASSYVDETSNETRWLSVTEFQPTAARSAFPCLDEPNYKANFTIWLGHHKSLTALSNMPLERQITLEGLEDYVWSIFEESVPMSTYLVAYTVNDFVYKETKLEDSDVVFRVWSRRDYVAKLEYVSEVGSFLLNYYEKLFNIPFPLKKLDSIAIPDKTISGMENWGLITYKEPYILYTPNETSQMLKTALNNVVAHELAHQWFGNLVTMKWWSDLWLNEGFATYIATLGENFLHPENERYNIDSLHNTLEIFRTDAELSSHPISQPILNTGDIVESFDSISYNKGSGVLRMLHMFMGNEGFFEGVRDYLLEHKYSNAEQDDLWAAFTDTAKKYNRIEQQHNMKTIMDSWTLQAGYPLVKVHRNLETGSWEISQQRFLINSTARSDEDTTNKCWWVPLSYTTTNEWNFSTTTPKTWLECNAAGQSVPLKLHNITEANEWIICNIQLAGVYRVMYDPENWQLIAKTLKSEHFKDIHVMNRAQLISDSMTLAFNGYQEYNIAIDILDYLVQESEYIAWKAASESLRDIFLLLSPFPQSRYYLHAYLKHIVKPIYFKIGGINDTMVSAIPLKPLIVSWACLTGVDDCVQTALNYFKEWKLSKNLNGPNKIPMDIKYSVYCVAMREGDTEDAEFLWQRLRESRDYFDRLVLSMSLGCSRNETTINRSLDMLFQKENRLKRQEVLVGFHAIASGEFGGYALKYYVENISKLHENFDVADLLMKLSSGIASTSSQSHTKLTELVDANKEYFKKSEKRVRSALETIKGKEQWLLRNLEPLTSHLKHRLSLMESTDE